VVKKISDEFIFCPSLKFVRELLLCVLYPFCKLYERVLAEKGRIQSPSISHVTVDHLLLDWLIKGRWGHFESTQETCCFENSEYMTTIQSQKI